MNLTALQQYLRAFATARHWQSYHAPKNLAMALMVEAAELLELFQWQTLPESRGFTRKPEHKEQVGDELADVLLYLLQLADHTEVDIEAAVLRKLEKNAVKYPPQEPALEPKPFVTTLPPSSHLLIDWENVQPSAAYIASSIPVVTDVWLFHGPHQKIDQAPYKQQFGANHVTLVPRTGSGKNALDFQLSYYLGYISARHPQARFIVLSNDQGYDPMLEHAKALGFTAERQGWQKPAAPVTRPQPSVQKLPQLVPPSPPPMQARQPPLPMSLAQIAWRAWKVLRTLPLEQRPQHTTAGIAYLLPFVPANALQRTATAQKAWELVQIQAQAQRRQASLQALIPTPVPSNSTSVTAVRTSTKTTPQPSAPKPKPAPKLQTKPAPKPTPQPAPKPSQKTAAQKSPAAAKKQEPPVKKAAVPAAKKTTSVAKPAAPKSKAPSNATQTANRVLQSLKKMAVNKPRSRSSLLKVILTHLPKDAPDVKHQAQWVLAQLLRGSYVSLAADQKKLVYQQKQ